VVKTPIIASDADIETKITAYDSIFYETQGIKLNPKSKHMALVKEEIIIYNESLSMITGYCLIME
jgi:hypothetical protein